MKKILIVHGPNLNQLGQREPKQYGQKTLADIDTALHQTGQNLGYQILAFQSNSEGDIIDTIHHANEQSITFILINPAALTHTSIALRDALLATAIPFIEIHISNIYARESFRHVSYLADLAVGLITGFGAYSYQLALEAAHDYLQRHEQPKEDGYGHS